MILFSRKLLDEKKLSAYALAMESKISYSQVLSILNGLHAPSIGNARKLAAILDIPLTDLTFQAEGKD